MVGAGFKHWGDLLDVVDFDFDRQSVACVSCDGNSFYQSTATRRPGDFQMVVLKHDSVE